MSPRAGLGPVDRNNGQVVAALKHEPHEIEQRFRRLPAGADPSDDPSAI